MTLFIAAQVRYIQQGLKIVTHLSSFPLAMTYTTRRSMLIWKQFRILDSLIGDLLTQHNVVRVS